MKYRSKILRKFRRPALWGLAVAGVAVLAALWISAPADPVPSRRFTYRDGTSTWARHTWVERLDGKQTPVDVRSLSRWRRLRFGLEDVSAPAEVSDRGDDTVSENPEEQELAFGHDCNAAAILRYYNECRKDELVRQKRLCRCAAPYPADIQLLVDEAYDAAKRYAERYAVHCNKERMKNNATKTQTN